MFRTALILSAMATSVFSGTYNVTLIPPPTGFTIQNAFGINNSGQVAGSCFNGTNTQAFVGTVAGSTVIPLPVGWTNAAAYAVNSSGQVAGDNFLGGSNNRPFIGTAGGITTVPLPPGWISAGARAVNDSGMVVGSGINSASAQLPFIGTTAGTAPVPLPPGWPSGCLSTGPFSGPQCGLAGAGAVNASGQVAGFGVNQFGFYQAFIGNGAASAAIPLPTGVNSGTVALAVNDTGQVAGYASTAFSYQAFIGTVSGSSLIPMPVGATYTETDFGSINNRGSVVGYSDVGGWIWDTANGTRLLNNLVPSGWQVLNAVSINNNGLILANVASPSGTIGYAVLTPALPPTPIPSTLTLLLIGAALCWAWLALGEHFAKGKARTKTLESRPT
jgi:hypothetical protein